MATKLVRVEVKFPKWLEKLNASQQRIGMFVAAQMQTNRGMMFDKEGANNGHPKWAPLKSRSGMILSKTGTLRKSIAPLNPTGKAGPGGVVQIRGTLKDQQVGIETRLGYAPMMNFGTTGLPGGVLVPKNKKALRFKVNGKWVFAKSVKIEERRFDQWNNLDKDEMTVALTNLVARILNE